MFLALFALGIASHSVKNSIHTRFSKKKIDNGFGCDMCTQVVTYIEQLLKDQTVESEIATLVEQLCATFPSPYDSLCKSIIEQYLPSVLKWLEQGLETADICSKIGLCSTPKFHKKYNNEISCDMCKQVVNYAKLLLEDHTVESEIATLVEQLCASFPSPYDTLCKSTIEQYLPVVIEYIKNGLNASVICTQIELCSSMKSKRNHNKQIHLHLKKKALISCEMCNNVVNYVEKLLVDQTVEQDIATIIEQLCGTFTSPYDSMCNTLVENNLKTILGWIQQGIQSLEICTRVGFCPSESCNTCKSWFKWAEDKLQNITIERLWKLVSEECPKVPYLQYFCQTITEENIETYVSLILSNLPPEKCCEWIKVC